MGISLAIIEQRSLTCEGCDNRVEFDSAHTAVRCRARGGGSAACARCWAKLDAELPAMGCPVAGKWWYPTQPPKTAAAPAGKGWPCEDPGEPPEPYGKGFERWKAVLSACQWARFMTNLWRREGKLAAGQHWWDGQSRAGTAPGAIAATAAAAAKPATPVLPSPPVKPAGPAALNYTNAAGENVRLQNHFKGRSVFLLCGGPSLAMFDLKSLNQPGIVTMAINNAAALHRPTMWIGSDEAHHFLMSVFTDPKITKFFPWGRRREQLFDSTRQAFADTSVERCPNVFGLSLYSGFNAADWLQRSSICWGDPRTTMAAAIRVLFDLGFRRVFLAGCDWQMDAARPYAFEQAKDDRAARGNNNTYAAWNKHFAELRPILEGHGFHVFNCTPDSRLGAFERMKYRDAVELAAAEIGVDVEVERTAGLYGAKHLQNPVPTYDVSIITPTGDRPQCFALAERWMKRQTFQGKVQWIVVDDGQIPTQCTMGQKHVRRERRPDDPPHTLPCNMLEGLKHAKADKILIWEDDDWYGPAYVETMVSRLDEAEVVGESHAWYVRHNPPMYKNMNNSRWASWAATGFQRAVVPFVEQFCREQRKAHIDLHLWGHYRGSKKLFRNPSDRPLLVQMKGLPGRAGQLGHHFTERGFTKDPDQGRAAQWLGQELDAYAFARNHHPEGLSFTIGSKIGDLVYALATIKHMGGGHLCYREDLRFSYRNGGMFNAARELIAQQPYVKSFRPVGSLVGVDMEHWRTSEFSSVPSLAGRIAAACGAADIDLSKPWLVVDRPDRRARVIINRTARYQNPRFPWRRVLEKYAGEIAFIGLPEEHRTFQTAFGPVPYVETPTLLYVARIIKGADVFIGNQSSAYAIAEAMKVNTIQEVSPVSPDCIFERPNAVHGRDENVILPDSFPPDNDGPFYAQHGEDRWLRNNWIRLGLPSIGSFVEVGAGDGKTISNTAWLESIGWNGLLVEPDPRRLSSIKAARKARIDTRAAGDERGRCNFVLTGNPDLSGVLRSAGERITVEICPLQDMLNEAGIDRVDVLSIDTEGTELDVWRGLDVSTARPRIVFIEWNTAGMPDRSTRIVAALEESGYKVAAKLGGNLAFVPVA